MSASRLRSLWIPLILFLAAAWLPVAVAQATAGTGLEAGDRVKSLAPKDPTLSAVLFHVLATPPSAPTDLSAMSTAGAQIELAWTDNSDRETGFEIERSTTGSSGPFSLLVRQSMTA